MIKFIIFSFHIVTFDDGDFPVAFRVDNVNRYGVCENRKAKICEGRRERNKQKQDYNLRVFIDIFAVSFVSVPVREVLSEVSRSATASVFAGGGEVVVMVLPTSDFLLLLLVARGGLRVFGVLGVAFGLDADGGAGVPGKRNQLKIRMIPRPRRHCLRMLF